METEKSGLAALLVSILEQLSLLGKFTAFFGTVLILWSIASPEPVSLLAGIGLLFFTVSNGFWQDRHRGMIHFPGQESPRWYKRFAWSRVFLALVFFVAFLLVVRLWLRLPAVAAFLSSAGIAF